MLLREAEITLLLPKRKVRSWQWASDLHQINTVLHEWRQSTDSVEKEEFTHPWKVENGNYFWPTAVCSIFIWKLRCPLVQKGFILFRCGEDLGGRVGWPRRTGPCKSWHSTSRGKLPFLIHLRRGLKLESFLPPISIRNPLQLSRLPCSECSLFSIIPSFWHGL